MQRQSTDFSKLPLILDNILKELELLKEDTADWCTNVPIQVAKLVDDYGITIGRSRPTHSCSEEESVESLVDFRAKVAIPYIHCLLQNIRNRISGEAVKLLVSSSIFNAAHIPEETERPHYGIKEIEELAGFYGNEATVTYDGITYTSPPLLNKDTIVSDWRVFKGVLLQESILVKKENGKEPSLQEVKVCMERSGAYGGIFPEIFKLINIILVLPVGTASVERSFSSMKQIKTRLRNRLSDINLA